MTKSNQPTLKIDPQANIKKLSQKEEQLLKDYYADCQHILIKKNLSGSIEGRRVFWIDLWNKQDHQLAPQVVKLGRYSELVEEYRRYQKYVDDFVDHLTAQIKKSPVNRDDFGAMAYTAIGDDAVGKAFSFEEYYEQNLIEQVKAVLSNLFPRLGERWYSKRRQTPDYSLPHLYFDHFYGVYFPADLTLTLAPNLDEAMRDNLLTTISTDYYILVVNFIASFADYGPIAVQIIGIIFLSRALIEVVNLFVDKLLLKKDKTLSEIQWQQRLTLTPLAKSLGKYAIFFGAFLLILRTLDINTTPILAAIGGIGLIVGLGAQPVISDLVSGAFILFENIYLVGDYVETGEAAGIVEAIDVRTTRLRDPDGQLHIIRNGQLGNIVNFSKGYIYAVVEVGVSYDANLDQVYKIIEETGKKLQQINRDVLEPTEVEGLAEFGESRLLIHTITKSKPGRHREVGYELRKMLKVAFEQEGIEIIPFTHRMLTFNPQDKNATNHFQK